MPRRTRISRAGPSGAREHQLTKPFTQTLDESNAPFGAKWFADGELNAMANRLDKHMGTLKQNKKDRVLS